LKTISKRNAKSFKTGRERGGKAKTKGNGKAKRKRKKQHHKLGSLEMARTRVATEGRQCPVIKLPVGRNRATRVIRSDMRVHTPPSNYWGKIADH